MHKPHTVSTSLAAFALGFLLSTHNTLRAQDMGKLPARFSQTYELVPRTAHDTPPLILAQACERQCTSWCQESDCDAGIVIQVGTASICKCFPLTDPACVARTRNCINFIGAIGGMELFAGSELYKGSDAEGAECLRMEPQAANVVSKSGGSLH